MKYNFLVYNFNTRWNANKYLFPEKSAISRQELIVVDSYCAWLDFCLAMELLQIRQIFHILQKGKL